VANDVFEKNNPEGNFFDLKMRKLLEVKDLHERKFKRIGIF